MRIGAQPGVDGTTFRVWAPTASRVDVVIYGVDAEEIHPLYHEEAGYFAGEVGGVGAGRRYRYRLDEGDAYPDPASRSQPEGVHGPSEVVDPDAYLWRSPVEWPGIPAERLVIYELHVGTFTEEGTFGAAIPMLDELAALGISAVELMPVANFPGSRNWGYDGVNLFAPATAYGGVDGLKRFVDAAHERGIGVVLDVVYNHFGPDGNYVPAVTGRHFFTDRHETPWGAGINYDGPDSGPVREFVIQNALHWCHEYRVDGLRLDATHAIVDDSEPHIIEEIAREVHALPGRHRFVIAEDERNDRRLVLPPEAGGFGLDAVWADDVHHQLRRLTAGDREGYFRHYSGTVGDVAATFAEGWWRNGLRGTADGEEDQGPGTISIDLPPPRFVHCIQNHDQVGNRAFGERLNHEIDPSVYRALSALLLLSPYTPLLWMGQEWAASTPFLFFTDFPPELGRLITEGRRREFQHFAAFRDPSAAATIPDPQASETFERSKLRWGERRSPPHAGILALNRELLRLRGTHPALLSPDRRHFDVGAVGEGAMVMKRWSDDGSALLLMANIRGEIIMNLLRDARTRPPEGHLWSFILATEELRFAGNGGWGRIEADGTLHVAQPGAVVLAGRAS